MRKQEDLVQQLRSELQESQTQYEKTRKELVLSRKELTQAK